MENKPNNHDLTRITYKDIMQMLSVSERTAKAYMSDLRKEFNLIRKKPVTKQLFYKYLSL